MSSLAPLLPITAPRQIEKPLLYGGDKRKQGQIQNVF